MPDGMLLRYPGKIKNAGHRFYKPGNPKGRKT